MNDWFRSWHGAPTDNKWLVVARRAAVTPGVVSAVVWALFDHASQAGDRGSVAGFDVETYAAFSGFEETDIQSVIEALKDKGVIGTDGILGSWDKRQPTREDGAAERAKAWRERKRNENERAQTHANANERKRTLDKTRLDTDKKEKISSDEPDMPASEAKSKKVVKFEYPGEFEMWWAEYPRHVGVSKMDAYKEWKRLPTDDQDAALEGAIAFAQRCRNDKTEEQYIVHPNRFLKQRRWETHLEAAQ